MEYLLLVIWYMINSNEIATVQFWESTFRYSFQWYGTKFIFQRNKFMSLFSRQFRIWVYVSYQWCILSRNYQYDDWCSIKYISIIYSSSNFTLQDRSEVIWIRIQNERVIWKKVSPQFREYSRTHEVLYKSWLILF